MTGRAARSPSGDERTRVIVLGASGSVGRQTLEVLRAQRERFAVEGLAARQGWQPLVEAARELGAAWVALTASEAARAARTALAGSGVRVYAGPEGLLEAIADARPAKVVAAMSGFAGLEPVLAAVERGFPLLLANKETLVAAGALVTAAARARGVPLIPVDSEHSAIFQAWALPQPVRRIILTCSGGPFLGYTRAQLETVGVEDALRHPRWRMGPKITVDSATLMNKGLEIIEAHWLFDLPFSRIDVVIHPESLVHSLVEFVDGAVLAELGWPDMRVPIQVALTWPDRLPLDIPRFDLAGQTLRFLEPDPGTFPALRLAREAGERGGLFPTVLNAANEVAVAAFLEGRLRFADIPAVVEGTLAPFQGGPLRDLADVREADRWGRETARQVIAARV
ncbi:1-deoxy-D-xylulose-5-phosphate reductoisomerase [Candidatus Hydrogenisulfobacillus filiaventi]|uniref:1-deoxy-D-xylulose 5-phosphate reductoisomerase n=1 Tax=Candidatus Hydrogenisulfobacillus filiaventi TaxID=2707344 RepID=A0A6F8ZGP3_9FIRM|nr:1-deoxy-D-xylulose-5-phosphate reductoisomerase [Bacillota bacterium]CAB1128762.1 1-deoxy-D-xylulose-5-phosphate reductoisomerase [Candidatus Hydrogenisulfobacillus filiaventi]